MIRLTLMFAALMALPAYADENEGRFRPILHESSGIIWVLDTHTGQIRSCRFSPGTTVNGAIYCTDYKK